MRALLPLLAALSAATPTPPRVLVLRAACDPPLPVAFHQARLLSYEPARFLFERYQVRLLSYEDTCGPEWRVSVTLQALAALSNDGSVLSAGCTGSDVCDALTAAAHVLRRPRPVTCAAAEARGAAVAALAARLRWRSALLPPAAPRSECGATLQEVTRALAAAGLMVHRAPLSPDQLARQPDVVILCASRGAGAVVSAGAALGAGHAGPPALLLHVEECLPAPRAASASPSSLLNKTKNDFQLSNITLVVSKSIGTKIKRQTSDQLRAGSASRNLSDRYEVHRKKVLSNRDSVRLKSRLTQMQYQDEVLRNKYESQTTKSANSDYDTFTQPGLQSDPVVRSDFKTKRIESFLPRIEIAFFRRLLLLTDEQLLGHSYTDDIAIYDQIIEAADIEWKAERTRKEFIEIDFHLYERSNGTSSSWSHAAVLTTTATRFLELADEWKSSVRIRNVTAALDSWRADAARVPAREAGAAALSAVAACGALALATSTALLVRWAATRRRRRRRRRDAVLAPLDFTFPVDEQRRVGEGMETMLSCWLQQLHEFGGPELERPDLLKQPPCVPPRAPSAPSSTCSINRVAVDRRIRYKGDVVHVKYLPATAGLELKRKATDVLLVMQNLRHENLNPFIGCLCELRPALVFEHCWRGSLEDVLRADDIKLDWTFRLSLLTDLVKGMRYLHASSLRVHGRLSSRNCVVDSRWVLRLTDYGLPSLFHAQALPHPIRTARDLLWTAPELLRERSGGGEVRGTQPGDVFSFAIIMQEVIVRGEPYCMLALTPDEIVEKVSRPPPLIRPSVSMGAAPPDAVSVMRQCWSEAPDLRPDFHRLHDIFRHLHRGRKINIVDSMFEMLEKYSNNLEELIKERTEQLDMEKKKTEQLLNRMLPRSVAERLMLGSRVEPEEFSEVSIYFSDIVGFTALAARSTPVQVVDLLNDLYTTFDAAIEQYRVYKVETIGDAYMVVGGLPVRTRDHAEAVATMALHLLHLAGRFRLRHLPDTPLHLRIGLHTGPVCAAVVGLTMPRYCLFGDTVNTASRMESTGAAWRIQVSAATADRLSAAGGYRLRSRGLTQIKGKGAMHTYWLLGKDGFDKPLPTPPPLHLVMCQCPVSIFMPAMDLLCGVPLGRVAQFKYLGHIVTENLSDESDVEMERMALSMRGNMLAHRSEEVLFEVDGENESESSPAPHYSPPPAHPAPPVRPALVERQRSDPTSTPDRQAWTRSGAVSADSSPPRPGRRSTDSGDARDTCDARDTRDTRDTRESRVSLALPGGDHSAQYSRYRCLGNGRRPLRRQWSLERGDALAAAAAGAPPGPASAPPSPPEPLALLAGSAPRAPAARYRTRPERDTPPSAPGPL